MRVQFLGWMLRPFSRRVHNGIGLVAVLGGKSAMCGHHVAERMNLLMIACRVRGDFRGLFSVTARAFQILSYLLATRDSMRRDIPGCSP